MDVIKFSTTYNGKYKETSMNKRMLLCTFSTKTNYKKIIEDIKKFYKISTNRFFVFVNKIDTNDVFITFNVMCDSDVIPKYPNTISVHRKKEYNVIYTLNSMNQIIKDENDGVLDRKYIIDWSMYSNSLIITGKPSIRIIPIELLEIYI